MRKRTKITGLLLAAAAAVASGGADPKDRIGILVSEAAQEAWESSSASEAAQEAQESIPAAEAFPGIWRNSASVEHWNSSPAGESLSALASVLTSATLPVDITNTPALDTVWTPPLPARWSALEEGRGPIVRSQGKYGTCWALTASSALETALLPEEHLVFSADHMALNNAYTVDVNEGGDYLMAMAYLSGWQGPVLEEEDPYGDGYSPEGLKPAVHVQEMQLLEDSSVEELKEAVHTYGAVQASLYMQKSMTEGNTPYFNQKRAAFYCPETREECHEVLILGWDDNFPRFYFSQIPDRDGAFICQNSWGEEFGQNGIFYVSYADANLGVKSILYTRVDPVTNYDRIYQTDDCGWVGRQGYDDETCWFANIYRAQSGEKLAAAGFYATGPDTSYEIYLSREPYSSGGFRDRELLASGKLLRAGYYTVDLPSEIDLTSGQDFGILVKIRTPGAASPVAVEYRANQYTQNVTTGGKQGYLSQDGQIWTHTESRYGTNVCLKAYTRSAAPY